MKGKKKMKTTLGEIKKHGICADGYKHLCENLGKPIRDETEVTILEILDINGVKDAFRLLRIIDYKDYCLVLVDVAEAVLPVFEKTFPDDDSLRKAIQAIRDYKVDKITTEELVESSKAVYNAVRVALVAHHNVFTTCTSAYRAYSVAQAVYAAVNAVAYVAAVKAAEVAHNAYIVAKAAYKDAKDLVDDTEVKTFDVANYANDAVVGVKQWKKNDEILRNYL